MNEVSAPPIEPDDDSPVLARTVHDGGPLALPEMDSATELVFLIEFRWQVSTGVQPVLFAERVLLH